MRHSVPFCVLLAVAAPASGVADQPAYRSPLAVWAEDVASSAIRSAAPFVGPFVQWDEAGRLWIDRARPLHACLDRSAPLIGVDRAWATGHTGRGVLIAIVDSGVDFTHPAFLNEDGTSRILWYLDMTLPTRGERQVLDDLGFALFDQDDLSRALRDPTAPGPSPDTSGHGSRVASIAAGSVPPYLGVAPDAELLVVRADRLPGGRYDEADVARAVEFAFAAAQELGRPCVVNLSLGGQLGAHDGSSWLERRIDALTAEGPGGRAVVVAAGNDAESAVHAVLLGAPNEEAQVDVIIPGHRPLLSASVAVVFLDLWSAPDRSFSLQLRLPDGATLRVDADSPSTEAVFADHSALRLELVPAAGLAARQEAVVAWTGGEDGTIPTGRYAMTLAGDGPVDAYLSAEALPTLLPFRLEGPVRREGTLALPATARAAIVVGSLVSRSRWINHLGQELEDSALVPLAISGFSAAGPTADGRFKPDLLAPGEWILGAQSIAAELPDGPGGWPTSAPDPRWSAGRGTSLAAPHVTGVAALLLEHEPGLHAAELLDRLRGTTRSDAAWSLTGGFGIVDATAALVPPPSLSAGEVPALILSTARSRLDPRGARETEVALVVRALDGSPRAIDRPSFVFARPLTGIAEGGTVIPTARLHAVSLPAGSCARTTAALPAAARTASTDICVAAGSAPTGCAAAPSSSSSSCLPFMLLLAMAAMRRARSSVPERNRAARHWPFLVVSIAAHLLLLALLVLILPSRSPDAPDAAVAMNILLARPAPVASPSAAELAAIDLSPPARPNVSVATSAASPSLERPAPERPLRRRGNVGTAPVAPVSSGTSAASAEDTSVAALEPGAGSPDPSSTLEAGAPALVTAAFPPSVPLPPAARSSADPVEDACRSASSSLRAAVDAQVRYPALARRRHVIGTTLLSFTLAADGSLLSLVVVESSGSPLLDDAAQDAVTRAAPFPVGACTYELPVAFRLDD